MIIEDPIKGVYVPDLTEYPIKSSHVKFKSKYFLMKIFIYSL